MIGRPPSDEKTRFLSKVLVMETGCHEWQAGIDRGGREIRCGSDNHQPRQARQNHTL